MSGEAHTAENDAPSMGQWARDVAADYRALAERETWDFRGNALRREARKYEAIADRMDRVPRVTTPEVTDAR